LHARLDSSFGSILDLREGHEDDYPLRTSDRQIEKYEEEEEREQSNLGIFEF